MSTPPTTDRFVNRMISTYHRSDRIEGFHPRFYENVSAFQASSGCARDTQRSARLPPQTGIAFREVKLTLLDANESAPRPRFAKLWDLCLKPAPISISQIATLQALVGLSLLYASAYFLPLLRPAGVYFLPSNNVLTWVVLPSLVVIIVVLAAYYVLRPVVLRWGTGRAAALFWVLLLSILAVIAVKGLFSAADSDWRYVIPLRENLVSPILLTTVQRIKDIVCVGVLLAIWAMRGHLARLTRILSSMGFAFAAWRWSGFSCCTGAQLMPGSHLRRAQPRLRQRLHVKSSGSFSTRRISIASLRKIEKHRSHCRTSPGFHNWR